MAVKGQYELALMLCDFSNCSGLRINADKTQAIWLNGTFREVCPELNLRYVTTFKLLGIMFSTDLSTMDELNYPSKIIDILKIEKLYKGKCYTMQGNITIVKMFMLPKLIHILSVLPSITQGEIS